MKQKYYKSYFVKSTSTTNQVVCYYCNHNGHMKNRCLVKRNAYYGVKCVWVPKGTIANIEGSKKVWVPKTWEFFVGLEEEEK